MWDKWNATEQYKIAYFLFELLHFLNCLKITYCLMWNMYIQNEFHLLPIFVSCEKTLWKHLRKLYLECLMLFHRTESESVVFCAKIARIKVMQYKYCIRCLDHGYNFSLFSSGII